MIELENFFYKKCTILDALSTECKKTGIEFMIKTDLYSINLF